MQRKRKKCSDSTKAMIQDIENAQLKEIAFTDHLFREFMNRKSISVRQSHFCRRGFIDDDKVPNFLKTLSQEIRKYGWSMIFNMDKTSVRIININDKTIAPTCSEENIIILRKRY